MCRVAKRARLNALQAPLRLSARGTMVKRSKDAAISITSSIGPGLAALSGCGLAIWVGDRVLGLGHDTCARHELWFAARTVP